MPLCAFATARTQRRIRIRDCKGDGQAESSPTSKAHALVLHQHSLCSRPSVWSPFRLQDCLRIDAGALRGVVSASMQKEARQVAGQVGDHKLAAHACVVRRIHVQGFRAVPQDSDKSIDTRPHCQSLLASCGLSPGRMRCPIQRPTAARALHVFAGAAPSTRYSHPPRHQRSHTEPSLRATRRWDPSSHHPQSSGDTLRSSTMATVAQPQV